MPENDLWVTGVYVANDYKLTIHYVDDKGNTLAPDYTETLKYGAEYSVTSPLVEGWIAETLTVAGTVGASDTEVTVRYKKSDATLTIVYLKEMPDGSTVQLSVYSEKMKNGDTYSVSSPSITGYTPDRLSVSGTMTTEGVTVYVTYSPDSYLIHFSDTEGGNAFEDAFVIFDRTYGYRSGDGSSYTYAALPTPIRLGYTFLGWYLNGERVTETTAVATVGEHTLTATWEALSFDLTVRYVYASGALAAEEVTTTLPFGAAYSYSSPVLYGHTANALTVSGTMPAQNTVLVVTYDPNTLTLTIEYRDSVDTGKTVAPSVTVQLSHGESYAIESPTVEGYDNCSEPTVSGVADAPLTQSTLTHTVYYYLAAPTISVTVTWGELSFDLTDRGEWDPETHVYGTDTFAPSATGTNSVTVENGESSTVSVFAEYSYAGYEGFEELFVYFTAENSASAKQISKSELLAKGESTVAYVWVEGKISPFINDTTVTSGVCTVTIKGGAEE